MTVMAFKIKKPKLRFHTRSIIAGAFVLLICAAAYTDHRIGKGSDTKKGDYLYTATTNKDGKDQTKILGEAEFVDSTVLHAPEIAEQTGNVSGETAEAVSYDTYFSAMQTNRQRSRREAYEMLQNVVESAESMPDVKEKAYNEMMVLANNMTVEANIQSMVIAKGFEDCLAVINGDNLNVVVKTTGLLMNEVTQIKEIAVNESGFAPENITIVEKNN